MLRSDNIEKADKLIQEIFFKNEKLKEKKSKEEQRNTKVNMCKTYMFFQVLRAFIWKTVYSNINSMFDVTGKNCIIFDDIIDTAGTIAEASKLLKKKGAKDIYVCAAHGLFNGEAMKRLNDAPVKEVIVTNSVPKKPDSIDKIKQVDLSVQIAEAMRNISAKS